MKNEEIDETYDAADKKVVLGEAKWYVLHTISGYENVAKQNLQLTVEKFNLQDRIFKIVIPVEEKLEEKKGKQVIVTEKLMPTYIFVKMIYGDDLWHMITRTRGITGFVGPKGRPLALTAQEIANSKLEDRVIDPTICRDDTVQIVSGILEGRFGRVEWVDTENERCGVVVEEFGVDNSLEMDLNNLRKVHLDN
jgi:transcriptional antiterminator NusG